MRLNELIKRLEAADPTHTVRWGFGEPASYRGYYEDVAFVPAEDTTVGEMLQHARGALGQTFEGYKGGEYLCNDYTDCWISHWGTTERAQKLGHTLLDYMLQE